MAEAVEKSAKLGRNYFKLFGASTISNLGDGIGIIAYPWLASAVTRNAFLVALVGVVQRLPWLVFSLPAGVITDRYDRRLLMVLSNAARAVMTLAVAFVVLGKQGALPGPDEISAGEVTVSTDWVLYGVVLVATLLMGIAEVLYDNSAQTFMPSVVDAANLERANGRLWSMEQVANTFVGPPLGALLLVVAFSIPFFVDAATFAVSAALIALIPSTRRSSSPSSTSPGTSSPSTTSPSAASLIAQPESTEAESTSWRTELVEGFNWLWSHELLRPLAIVLGLLNMLSTMSTATLVLFAQEVLDTSPTEFALLSTGGAVGGVIGGWTASWISKRIGSGPSLYLTLVVGGLCTIGIGLAPTWPVAWALFGVFMLLAVLWNVITVSLRQTIIPDNLLGRVNSVYRFFGWGMMPVGAALGGLTVWACEAAGVSRETALRMPFVVAGGLMLVLFVFAKPKLTSAKIDRAKAEAPAVVDA